MSFHTSQRAETLSHPSDAARNTVAQDNAIYVRDHIADGSRFQPGATIQQSWTVRNSGTTPWGAGYQLALLAGEALGAMTAIAAPPTPPGTEANLSVTFTAPSKPGSYRGYWKLRNPAGTWFGERLWIDIQVEAAVKPLTVKRGNKLGFYLHLSTDQHGLWEAIRRVEPPVLLIHADTANSMLLQEIRRFRAPDAFVIGRLYKDGHTQRQMLESVNPEAQGRALAEEILNYNFGLATQRGANGRLLIDAWMSLNEAVPGPGSDQFKQQPAETRRLLHHYDRFQVAFRERLQIAGVEAIAFNFGAGNFGLAEHYLDHFPNTLAHYVYLGFHEYGWPTLYPAAGSATSGGSYRRCMEGIRARYGDRHRVIITEAGLTRMYQNPAWGDVGWLNSDAPLSEEQYWQSLAWYNQQMTEDAYVVGACLYEVGHHGNWASFRHLGPDNRGQPIGLIDRIVALKDEAQPRGLEPLFAPRPLLPPLTIGGSVTSQGKAVAGATVRLVGSQETLGTVRNAAAAGAAVTWTRRVTGVTGSVWNCWRKYVASTVAGLTYAEFKQLVSLYNPALQESEGQFNATLAYFLPENPHHSEIVWDRPLTAFAGSIQACWQHYVANRVVGLPYADFKKQVLRHNPTLKETDRRFLAEERYTLPRNVDQEEYALTTTTNSQGRFRFTKLPPGHYRVDVSTEGYWPFTSGFACQATLELPVTLRPVVEQAATRALPSAFMGVASNEFVRNGQQFRFVGVNIRGIVHYGDGQTLPASNDGQRFEQLKAANEAGVRVVRIFLPSVNANVQQTIERLRNLITLLQTHFPEMYILPALTNLYADVPLRVPGDDHFYQDNVLVKAFFTDGYQNNYLPFVRQVVEAFRDEAQIFAWEIGNELKLDRGNKADENDPNPRHYIDFVHTIAAFIRRLDPNHLITTGMISTRHAWLFAPPLKRRLYESPNLDFVTIHAYQGSNEEDDSPVARELSLPFIIEEAGFDAKQGEDRSAKVAEDMTKWFGLGARGYMQWGFMATPDNGDGDRQSGMDRSFHSDWDQLLRTYRERAEALAQIDPNWRPPQKKQPDKKIGTGSVDTPVGPSDGSFSQGQTVFAQDWLNVRKSPGFVNKAGDDVLGMLALGAPATVTGASVAQDELIWWPIHATLATGATVAGWAAAARETQVLLSSAAPRSLARATRVALRAAARAVSRAVATEIQQAFAQSVLNLRRDPGYVGKPSDHVLGQIPYGAPVMVLAGPESADGLTWWQVRAPLLDNSTAEGWVAEIDPNGLRLLDGTPPPPLETVITETDIEAGATAGYLGRPFTLDSAVTVVATVANVRASTGYLGKPPEDVLALAPRGAKLLVLAAPTPADGIDWLQVQGEPTPGQAVTGWVAIADPSGLRLVAPAPVAIAIRIQRPFAERWALSQRWGVDPESYSKITYDGVPLQGHNGLDFATPVGTPLVAVDEGVVKRVDYEAGGFGHFILLEHTWGESLYAHLDRIDVRQNTPVTAGQIIGLSGETGNCRGAHLHFGIRLFPYRRTDGWGGFCDPTPFLDPADLIATRGFFNPPEAMTPELPGWRRP